MLLLLVPLLIGSPEELPPLRPGDALRNAVGVDAAAVGTEALAAAGVSAVGRAYAVEVEESAVHTIELHSHFFDAYLVLRGGPPDGPLEVLAEDDDGGLGRHARLVVPLRAGHRYRVEACARGEERGAFELRLDAGEPAELDREERQRRLVDDLRARVVAMEEAFGADSLALADALDALGEELIGQGSFSEALPSAVRQVAIRREVQGARHPDVALALVDLGSALRGDGDATSAFGVVGSALAIQVTADEPQPVAVADTLARLAPMLTELGYLEQAFEFADGALAIREHWLGGDAPETAASLYDLGVIWFFRNELERAREHFVRALEIFACALGEDHVDAAETWGFLAKTVEAQGDFVASRAFAERAYAIEERALGPHHPRLIDDLRTIAFAHEQAGEVGASRPLYERILAIAERSLGAHHPETAQSLDDLAGILMVLGEVEVARPLYERSIAVRERVMSPDHPDLAASVFNLAWFRESEGDLEGALEMYGRAVAIYEASLAPDHFVTTNARGAYADLLVRLGRMEEAGELYARCLESLQRKLGPRNLYTATLLMNIAVQRYNAGAPDEALALLERSVAMQTEILGPDHGTVLQSTRMMAEVVALVGDYERAAQLLRHARETRRPLHLRTLAALTESERYRFVADELAILELELAVSDLRDDPEARLAVFEAVVEWKSEATRWLTASRRRMVADLSADERRLLEELRATTRELSSMALELETPDPDAHMELLVELGAKCNRIELQLQRLATPAVRASVSFPELRDTLGERTAVVDFVARYAPAVARDEQGRATWSGEWSPFVLTAWITRPSAEYPIQVELGPVDDVIAAVRDYLDLMVARRGERLGGGPDPGVVLRQRLWDPLAPHLEDVELVILSPDRVLGTLPFETIPLPEGRFLIERHAFVYLQDVTSLVGMDVEPPRVGGDLLSMGGVDFRAPSERTRDQERSSPGEAERSFSQYWTRLPATRLESQTVFDLHETAFGATAERQLLQGDEPTEERLGAELARYSVLHLATHGFFEAEGVPSMWEMALDGRGEFQVGLTEDAWDLLGRHPGLLSGLVCAGANANVTPAASDDRGVTPVAANGDGDGDLFDGYLTAEEVGWLDLSDVELVVLSACETGLGRPRAGQGLMGLRRAFRTAGARTVISSLWSIQDESTSELMRDFYVNLWLRGMGRLQSLRSAQLAMLARQRAEEGHPHPMKWGAFVLSGEWR